MNKADLIEYLTQLYLENQDLSELSPAALLDKYAKVKEDIQNAYELKYPPQPQKITS